MADMILFGPCPVRRDPRAYRGPAVQRSAAPAPPGTPGPAADVELSPEPRRGRGDAQLGQAGGSRLSQGRAARRWRVLPLRARSVQRLCCYLYGNPSSPRQGRGRCQMGFPYILLYSAAPCLFANPPNNSCQTTI